MLVLQIAAALAVLSGAIHLMLRFGRYCQARFGYRPLAAATACLWQLCAIIFYLGWLWMLRAAQMHGDMLNGILVAGAGCAGGAALLVNAAKRTNLLCAPVVIALQIALAVIVVPPLSLAWLVGDHFANRGWSGAQSVRIRYR